MPKKKRSTEKTKSPIPLIYDVKKTFETGDVVKFVPLFDTTEVYPYEVPPIGTVGKVTELGLNTSFQSIGVELPMAAVAFDNFDTIALIFTEDLQYAVLK